MTTRGRRKRISPEDLGPYSNYPMAIRLELTQRTGVFAALAAVLAKEPIVFALANPDPEITSHAATPYCRV